MKNLLIDRWIGFRVSLCGTDWRRRKSGVSGVREAVLCLSHIRTNQTDETERYDKLLRQMFSFLLISSANYSQNFKYCRKSVLFCE